MPARLHPLGDHGPGTAREGPTGLGHRAHLYHDDHTRIPRPGDGVETVVLEQRQHCGPLFEHHPELGREGRRPTAGRDQVDAEGTIGAAADLANRLPQARGRQTQAPEMAEAARLAHRRRELGAGDPGHARLEHRMAEPAKHRRPGFRALPVRPRSLPFATPSFPMRSPFRPTSPAAVPLIARTLVLG